MSRNATDEVPSNEDEVETDDTPTAESEGAQDAEAPQEAAPAAAPVPDAIPPKPQKSPDAPPLDPDSALEVRGEPRKSFTSTGGGDYGLGLGPPPPALDLQQTLQDHQAFQNDLQYGKINPKSYSDLFAEKSTVGKIGSLFGLLLSGAGSGLAHQPNMVMEMMNREIERDLEAQKQNQGNKQNWYRLALENERNKAQNKLTEAHTIAQQLTSQGIPSDNIKKALDADMQRYQADNMGVKDLSATNTAYVSSAMNELQGFKNKIDSLPDGPDKQRYQQQYENQIYPFFMNKIMEHTTQTVQKKGLIRATNAQKQQMEDAKKPPETGEVRPVVNQGQLQALENKARQAESKGFAAPPGSIPSALQGRVRDEIAGLDKHRKAYASWDDGFHKLLELGVSKQLPLATFSKAVGDLVGGIAGGLSSGGLGTAAGAAAGDVIGSGAGKEIENYTNRERNVQTAQMKEIEALLPSYADRNDPKKLAEVYRKGKLYFKNHESTPTLDGYPGLKTPFPNYQLHMPEKSKEEKAQDQKVEKLDSVISDMKPKGL